MKDNERLKETILKLLEQKQENEYFDIKLKWHEKIEDLIKDIICFSNTTHEKDCYIIFGVEDGTFEIKGLSSENRKKQADILDALDKLTFISNERPKISVDTLWIDNKEIDILTIFNTDNTPIYLDKNYGKIKRGCIYVRELDRNTL